MKKDYGKEQADVINEKVEWFAFCGSLRLCFEILEPEQLEYSKPFFEFNALRAKGVKDFISFWSKRDLAVLFARKSLIAPAPIGVIPAWQY